MNDKHAPNGTRRQLILAGLMAPAVGYVFGAPGNPIPAENALTGVANWRVQSWPTFFNWQTSTYGVNTYTEIEGYMSASSVNIGESIKFHVNCRESTFTIRVYRLGWYNGAGARLMYQGPAMPGGVQTIPTPDALGKIECNWTTALTLPIPNTWVSGIYLVKLIAGSSKVEALASFIVRDDARVADFILQSTYNTSQAYNNWGGKSLYEFNSKGSAKARSISFNRPDVDGGGCGQIMHWELSMVRFLEREGYDVKYIANVDVHSDATRLLKAKAFLSVGHDEYWSYEQKAGVQAAQAAGIHTGFLSSNTCYWQVRYAADNAGVPNRTMISYKEQAAQDPFTATDRKRITGNWRDFPTAYGVNDPVARPENGMIGVQYHGDPVNSDLIVANASHWMFAGSGAVNGTKFLGLLGYETDSMFNNGYQPADIKKIMESPDPYGFSHSVYFTTPSGAAVFGAGTMQWSWGVDFCASWAPNSGTNRATAAFQQINRNLLNRMLIPAIKAPINLTASTARGSSIVLKWDASADATSYDVYRSTTPNQVLGTPIQVGVNAPTIADTNVTVGTTYYYVVVAKNGNAESYRSVEISAQATSGVPLIAQSIAFGALSAHVVGDTPFVCSATASSGLPVTFTSLTPAVATVSGNTVTLVGPGTATIAANQTGNGQYSAAPQVTQSFTVTAPAVPVPQPPSGLSGYACADGCWAVNQGVGVRINWSQSPSPNITSNTIWRGDGLTGVLSVKAVIPAGIFYLDTDVVAGRTYHYQISATNAGGTSVNGNDTAVPF